MSGLAFPWVAAIEALAAILTDQLYRIDGEILARSGTHEVAGIPLYLSYLPAKRRGDGRLERVRLFISDQARTWTASVLLVTDFDTWDGEFQPSDLPEPQRHSFTLDPVSLQLLETIDDIHEEPQFRTRYEGVWGDHVACFRAITLIRLSGYLDEYV